MRLLSIGYPLPDPRIDNYTILNAPALFDYDAVLVDPAGVSAAIQTVLSGEDEMRSATDEPVLNASGGPLTAGLADLLRGRLAEAERTLARGGVIIVIGQPNVAIPGVAGFAGCDRYFWLPAPSGVHWGSPDLLMASGSGAIPADMTHPLAGLIDEYRARVRYRAHFATTPVITREGHLIARSPGGATIGIEFRVGPGRIAFIPAPNVEAGPDRGPVASHLFDAARRMLELPPTEKAPSWVGAQSLPGLEQREPALEEARSAFEAAEARLEEAQSGVDALARFRRLLWCEGKFALEPVVFDALRLLGFETRGLSRCTARAHPGQRPRLHRGRGRRWPRRYDAALSPAGTAGAPPGAGRRAATGADHCQRGAAEPARIARAAVHGAAPHRRRKYDVRHPHLERSLPPDPPGAGRGGRSLARARTGPAAGSKRRHHYQ